MGKKKDIITERDYPTQKKLMVDPPEGWKYGFPKVIPKEHQIRTLDWLVENGYPRSEIDKMGSHFYCRYWEIE